MKVFKKITALFCTLLLVVSVASVGFANNDGLPLYEKYDYNENFEYEGEMIGHALKTSVAKIVMYYSAEIEYRPVLFNAKAFGELVRAAREAYPDYSDEELKQFLIAYLQSYPDSYIAYGSTKRIDTSGQATGTGVVIGEDGYIATNTHVISFDDNTKMQIYENALGEEIYYDLVDIFEEVASYGIYFTEDEMYTIYYYVLYDALDNAYINSEGVDLEVWFPTAKGGTSEDDAVRYEAELLEVGTAEGKESLTEDAAILKIDAENLVALKISEELAEINSEITAAGFPGASDAIFQGVGSTESVMSITVNKGEVSKQVPIDGAKYKALETSVRISPGNSGGPSVDNRLEIEGLNTYSLSADSRYAYMISAECVKDMAEGYEIGQDEVSKTFLLGLQALQQDYGKTAVECFKRVKELKADTPYIDSLIKVAEKAPQEEMPSKYDEDKSGFAEFIEEYLVLIIIGVVALVVIAAIVVVLIIVLKKKNKASKPEVVATPPAAPVAPPRPYAPPVPPATPYTPHVRPAQPQPQAPVHSGFRRGDDLSTPTPGTAPTPPSAPTPQAGSGLKMSSSFKKSDDLD